MPQTPYNLSRKEFKSRLIRGSFSVLRNLKLFKYIDKTFKFVSGTDWETEVFIEFPIKKTSFGITEEDVLESYYTFHYIIQDVQLNTKDIKGEETIDYDLTFYVKYKGGTEFEKIIQDGDLDFDF